MDFQDPSFQFQQFSFQSPTSTSTSPSTPSPSSASSPPCQRPRFHKSHSYDHVQHVSPLSSVSDFAETSILDVHILSQQFSLQQIHREDKASYKSAALSPSPSPTHYSYSSSSATSPTSSSGSSPVMSTRTPSFSPISSQTNNLCYHSSPRTTHNRSTYDHSFIRSQRQAASRLQTQLPHKQAIAQLVSRMVDSHEQCLTRRATATSITASPISSPSTVPSTPTTALHSISQSRSLSASSAPATPTTTTSFASVMAVGSENDMSRATLEIQGSVERAMMRPRRMSERPAVATKGWVSKRIKVRKGWRKRSA